MQWNDVKLARLLDGTIQISLIPSVNISGWDIRFRMSKRFGGSGLIQKSASSGYTNGQSGIQIVNDAQGIFNIDINSVETSGLDFGCYAHSVIRYNSGFYTPLVQGFIILVPGEA